MEGLACTSCSKSTPKSGVTIVGSRRIVRRAPGAPDDVLSAEAISQTCPSCVERSKYEDLEIGCYFPPFLDIEYESTMDYLRGTLTEQGSISIDGCSVCSAPVTTGVPFVEASIASEWYIWKPGQARRETLDPKFRGLLSKKNVFDLLESRSDPGPNWEQLVHSDNRIVFAEICGNCSDHYWGVKKGSTYFKGQPPCATPECPVCLPLRG